MAADTPFPGAHSQVRGSRHEALAPAPRAPVPPRALALDSSPAPSERGWSVRLPVRAEQISIDKQVVVYERVAVRRNEIEQQAHLQVNVRREELRVSHGQPSMSPSERRSESAN